MTICLLLPLTWGGVTRRAYPDSSLTSDLTFFIAWNDRVVIALFVTVRTFPKYANPTANDMQFGVLAVLLVLWERHLGDRAMMPISILFRRTQVRSLASSTNTTV